MNFLEERYEQRMRKVRQPKGVVYAITNIVTGRKYIGSTITRISARWNAHRLLLKKGKHHNKRLQADYDVYGPEAFAFAVLEKQIDEKHIRQREREYIQATACNYNSKHPDKDSSQVITLHVHIHIHIDT